MKKLLALSTALTAVAVSASADVTVMSWGGSYGTSQMEAYIKPYIAETGVKVTMVDADNPATPVKAMVEANNVTVDVADVEYADAIRLCDEGMLEEIDPAILPAAPDGTPATDDFLPGALTDCAVATIVFSTVFAYDSSKFPEGPKAISDFFDLEKFPGKRAMRKGAKANLEMALMADGVAKDALYPIDMDRALAKIKAEQERQRRLEAQRLAAEQKRIAEQQRIAAQQHGGQQILHRGLEEAAAGAAHVAEADAFDALVGAHLHQAVVARADGAVGERGDFVERNGGGADVDGNDLGHGGSC